MQSFRESSTVGWLLMLAMCLEFCYAQTKPALPKSQSAEAVYRNSTFGLSYRIPFGWVDRTKDMQPGTEASKGEVLLAVFERPPQAAGETVNSAVVIAAEDLSNYPDMKKAEDYLSPLNELMASKGFKGEGDPSELMIDQRGLIRADFSKPITDKISMHQATLVMLAKAKVVSLTFIADSDDALDNLIERISFAPATSSPRR